MRASLSRLFSLSIVMTALVAHADGKTGTPPPAGGAGAAKPTTTTALPASKNINLTDEPGKIAVAYLKALGGDKDQSARELLLGGLTLTAEEASVSTWRILGRDAKQVEDANVKAALDELRGLDNAGRKTLSAVVQVAEDDVELQAISQEQAEKIMAPTHEAAKRFQAKFPVFSYCARVGKDVYWHPSNPWRSVVMPQLGDEGDYHLELHLFHIEETVKGQPPRVWPLRVLRIQTKKWDSGWKILPASDWDPEY